MTQTKRQIQKFELDGETKVKITEVDVLSDKDRAPDTNPGAAISVAMTVGNDSLTMFDPNLRAALYMKVDKKADPQQQGLEGVPKVNGVDITSDMPKLTPMGLRLGEFGWDLDLSGYVLNIDYGTGGPSNIELKDCLVGKFRFSPKEGGSVGIKYRVEAPDVNADIHGKLAMLKTRETVITLIAPKVEGEKPASPFKDDQQQLGSGEAGDGKGDGKGAWPFPNNPQEALEKATKDATVEA